jgi:hypothetical protein
MQEFEILRAKFNDCLEIKELILDPVRKPLQWDSNTKTIVTTIIILENIFSLN